MSVDTDRKTLVTRTIRASTSTQQQNAEAYCYWQSRTTAERMKAIDEIVIDGYAAKGIDLHVQRSDRSLVRIQRPQR